MCEKNANLFLFAYMIVIPMKYLYTQGFFFFTAIYLLNFTDILHLGNYFNFFFYNESVWAISGLNSFSLHSLNHFYEENQVIRKGGDTYHSIDFSPMHIDCQIINYFWENIQNNIQEKMCKMQGEKTIFCLVSLGNVN